MIDWLLQQSLVLGFLISVLILLYRFAISKIGARTYYWLWLVIPAQLFLSLALSESVVLTQYEIPTYIVSAGYSISEVQQSLIFSLPNLHIIWFSGVVILSTLLFLQHRLAIKQLNARPVSTDNMSVVPDKKILLLESDTLKSPMITGLIYPRIVLPADFSSQPIHVQELLIKHESIHWQRGDLWWNAVAVSMLLIFWFNPFMWWGYRQFRQAQELACDTEVLRGQNKHTCLSYAKAFLEQSFVHQRVTFTSLYYGEKQNMKDRINNMRNRRHSRLLVLPVIAILLSALGISQAVSGNHTHQAKKMINGIQPVMRIEPIYPEQAAKNELEGSVVLSYSVNTDGSVSDVEVVKSDQDGLFEAAATTALKQWTYTRPKHKMENLLVQLDFALGPDFHATRVDHVERISVKAHH